jgi:hypothetical protein
MAQYDLGPNGGALSFCFSVSVFQLENANPNSLNSDKKKEVNHVLAYWECRLNWGLLQFQVSVFQMDYLEKNWKPEP